VRRGAISSRVVVGAVLVLAVLAAADALRSDPASDPVTSPSATVSIQEVERPGGKPKIERIGDEWARRFAANGLDDCYHTGQELCEQLHCIHVGGYKLPNCRLPTTSYRRSFRAAKVDDVVIKQYRAAAMLSNGEMIELVGDGGTWTILELGGDAGRGFFEKPG
jgi:hypothetical protein